MTGYFPSLVPVRAGRRFLLGGAALAVLAATPAFAQSTQQAPLPAPSGSGSSAAQPGDVTAPDVSPAAAAGTQAASPAQSDTQSDSTIADIVVTAQKRAQNVQNVPIAITALGPAQLATAGVTDTDSLKVAAPALNVTTAVGGFGLPRIRGIGATGQGPGIENPVAVYVDGVYYGAAFGVLQSLYDAEQVAVLKGPQGTLFGRNATGGLIQVSTLEPSFTMKGKAQFGYSNYDTVDAAAYVTGGLSNTIAVSLSGQYENRKDGFGTNLYTGSPIDTASTYNGRFKLLWKPVEGTSVLLSADANGRDSTEPAFRQVSRNTLGLATPGSIRDIYADTDPLLHQTQYGFSATINQDLGSSFKLKSITAYRDSKLRTRFDPDGTVVPYIVVDNYYYDHQFSQELNLISSFKGPLQITLGAFYLHDSAGTEPGLITGVYTFGNNGYTADHNYVGLSSIAGYADATYSFDDATHLTAGVRYTSDDRSLSTYTTSYNGNIASLTNSATINAQKTFSRLTWRGVLDHRFSPELLAYASYNRGFRSGTFVPGGTLSLTLEPEVVDAYEVGLKSDLFDRRVRLNLSGYYYDQDRVQVQQVVAGRNSVYNADGAHIYGVDADLNIKVSRDLNLFGGASYIHARYTNFTSAVLSYPFPLATGFVIPTGQSCLGTFGNPFTQVGGNCLLVGDASGGRLQNTPTFTGSVGASYDIRTASGTYTLGGNYYYNSGFYGSVDGRVQQAHYNLVDASVTWRKPDGHLFVRFWGKNLTDAAYFTQIGATNSGDNGTVGQPRTYGGTIGFDF